MKYNAILCCIYFALFQCKMWTVSAWSPPRGKNKHNLGFCVWSGGMERANAFLLGSIVRLPSDVLFLKHDSRFLRHSSIPVCGFFMIEQVRLCTVWPTDNWLGSSMNHLRGRIIWISTWHALEQRCLIRGIYEFKEFMLIYTMVRASSFRQPQRESNPKSI